MTGERRTTPWLRRRGLWIAGALFVLGCAVAAVFTYSNGSFVAPWPRLLSAAVLAAVLVAVALRLPPGRHRRRDWQVAWCSHWCWRRCWPSTRSTY